MTPRVTLRLDAGVDPGKEYVFTRRTVGSLGRAVDCIVQVPSTMFYQDVSRHHCQFEVNPPEVRVRDLGSRNGTFVNGRLIGKRDAVHTPENALAAETPQHILHDGDELRVGALVLRVQIAEMDDQEAEAVDTPVGCMHAH